MMHNDEVRRIDIKEFRELGLLQEVNRQFFHPLGLALEVVVDEDGGERLGGVWDSRDDPEGFTFDEVDQEKATRVVQWQVAASRRRRERLGFVVQPAAREATMGGYAAGVGSR